jgi:uncharacterized protein YdaU (DUF1376 family)
MAKDPAFLFYPGDFNTGTQFFSDEQTGKYIRLLMAQHQHGHLPEKHMLIICKSYDKDVFSKFVKDSDGNWYNERLEIEIIKRKNYVESRSKNKEGKTKGKIMCESYDNHMENINRNKDINGIGIKEEVQEKPQTQEEIKALVFAEPNFIRNLKDSHPGKDYERAWAECYAYHSNRPNPPNQLWVWRQKVLTWLSNMKTEPAHTKPVKKKSYQEFIKKAS